MAKQPTRATKGSKATKVPVKAASQSRRTGGIDKITKKDLTKKDITKKGLKRSKPSKSGARSAKAQLDLINANESAFDEVRQLCGTKVDRKPKNVLETQSLREDLKLDHAKQDNDKKVNSDLTAQLELLTGMGL